MSLQHELNFTNAIKVPEHEALLNIVLTADMLEKEADRGLRPFGLTDAQLNVLMLLKHQAPDGSLSQTRLGDMLLVNRSNVTGLVDRMEQAGWVERIPDPEDRRIKRIQMTGEGRRILTKAERKYYHRMREVMGVLSKEENRQLCAMLEKVRERLRGGD